MVGRRVHGFYSRSPQRVAQPKSTAIEMVALEVREEDEAVANVPDVPVPLGLGEGVVHRGSRAVDGGAESHIKVPLRCR